MCGAPFGEFTLKSDAMTSGRPICFISGGVGLTPVLSMLDTLLESDISSPIYYIDAIRDQNVEAMHSYFEKKYRTISIIIGPLSI